MNYVFSYYRENDFDEIEELILASYKWEYPIWSISRHEFSLSIEPEFAGIKRGWERSTGVYRCKENNKLAACVISEGNAGGDAFFLFDAEERARDSSLIKEMLKFAKTGVSSVKENGSTRFVNLWTSNKYAAEAAEASGFICGSAKEAVNILPFNTPFHVQLPQGYSFADGETTPDFYLSNTHMYSFNYSLDRIKNSEKAFHNLRKMKHYNKKLDLCVLDENKRPVAMAVIWYDERMPYCELEPLGVAWWERRKGLATTILHEASNRVMEMYPNCKGMRGGDQPFYTAVGYEKKAEVPMYQWETDIYASWDPKSARRDYSKDI